ncbi:hypothetical protein GCK32_004296 [Trichostrongylus colubriformis]|uniref:Uncharacterized protein n=1 Tax=Trichostrongylus colubriformis TaxID=6319 RepID=A0AAN8FXD2_TRICO
MLMFHEGLFGVCPLHYNKGEKIVIPQMIENYWIYRSSSEPFSMSLNQLVVEYLGEKSTFPTPVFLRIS